MLKIDYDPMNLKLDFKGHAEGMETICAAASILLFTLHKTLKDSEEMLEKDSFIEHIEEGNSHIECVPKDEYADRIHRTWYTIAEGFKLLARDYPEAVEFNINF